MRRPAAALLLLASLAAAAPAHASGGERKKGGGLSFTQFKPLMATVVRPNGRRGVLSVEAGIDTPDPRLKARSDLMEPRLRDAYVQVLNAYAAAIPPGAPPDIDLLVQRLQLATDRVMGRPGSRLLIGTVIVN